MTLPRLQRLEPDAMLLHFFIEPEDEIYFFYEYTARRGFDHSPGNNLISNLKKDPVRFRDQPGVLKHKRRAISTCAQMISHGLDPAWLATAVIVPVPPSKARNDPAYDDRMLRVAQAVQILETPPRAAETRELVHQTISLQTSHASEDGERSSIDELVQAYALDEALATPEPERIVILDDMLTTGRHFRAMNFVLHRRFPRAQIVGTFITRRIVPEDGAFEDFFPDQ